MTITLENHYQELLEQVTVILTNNYDIASVHLSSGVFGLRKITWECDEIWYRGK